MNEAGERGRTVLVTGGAGFIGSALCRRLHTAGYRVVAYDNLSRGRQEHLPDGVDLVHGDIRDAVRVKHAVKTWRPAWVVHLAAMHFIPDCVARPQETIEVNVDGTRCVLDGCRDSSVRHVVFASTGAVYAPTDLPCREDATPLRPMEVYGESKVAGEQLVDAFHGDTGVSTTTLRLFNAIGRNETNAHVVPHIFESLRTSDVISLGNTAPRRDYIDTRDVAEAIVAVASGAQGSRLFNVGTGIACSVDDIVVLLRGILGRPISVARDPGRMRACERMLLAADIERIRRETRWTPRISLEDSLKDLAAAYNLAEQPDSSA